MKRLAKLIVLLSVVGLAAATAQAAVDTNIQVPLAPFTPFVPCANGGAGESVDLTGYLHVLITFTINANNVSGKIQVQPQGVKGVGLVTGDKYQATGVTEERFNGSFNNGQLTETFVNNFRLIGRGSGSNLLVHEIIHVTINASGEVTVFVDSFRVECR